MSKRIQEPVSDEAKAKLESYAKKHGLNQADALDKILLTSED